MFKWQKGADIDAWSVSKDRFLWTAPSRAYVRHTSVSLQEEKLIHWWNEWTAAGETDKTEQILGNVLPYTTKHKEQWKYLLTPDEDNHLWKALVFHCSLYDETQGTMNLSSYTWRRQLSVESACVSLFPIRRNTRNNVSIFLYPTKTIICRKRLCFIVPCVSSCKRVHFPRSFLFNPLM